MSVYQHKDYSQRAYQITSRVNVSEWRKLAAYVTVHRSITIVIIAQVAR